MRATTEQNLNEIWYGDREAPAWLRGLVPVYRIGNRVDRWWKSRQRPEDLAGACIIVVGNITVGGSGKSPLVIRLCRMLRDAGFELAFPNRRASPSSLRSSRRQIALVMAGLVHAPWGKARSDSAT